MIDLNKKYAIVYDVGYITIKELNEVFGDENCINMENHIISKLYSENLKLYWTKSYFDMENNQKYLKTMSKLNEFTINYYKKKEQNS